MAMNKSQEKTYHTLTDDNQEAPTTISETKATVETELYGSKNVKQKTFEFEMNSRVYDEFEGLYGNNPKKEPYNEVEEPVDYTQTSDEAVEELENIPAYRRKNMRFNGFKKKVEEKLSRFTISPDENNNVVLRDNNSFLHDNVD